MSGDVKSGRAGSSVLRWILILVTAAGLAVDAYVHFDLASNYDGNANSSFSQGDLFRLEAIVAIVVALALLVRPRWYTATLAFLVSAGGAVLVAVLRYVQITGLGTFVERMYEPVWYGEKTLSFVAEIVAALTALAIVGLTRGRSARKQDGPQAT